ncbi:hypothetical protein [Pseudomonas nicosulfuronedens]
MRDTDDLIKKLTAKLTEEVESLPEDGEDHEIRIKIKGNRGNINLGSQTFEMLPGKEPPPPGSDRARSCPQCTKTTWRYTQLCMHCDYDLRAHDASLAHEQEVKVAQEYQKRLVTVFGIAFTAALGLLYVRQYLPESLRSWAVGLAVACGVIAFIAMKAGETAK